MQSAENVTRRGNRVSRRTISMTVPRANRVPRRHGVASMRDEGPEFEVLRQRVVGPPPRLGSARSSKRAQAVRNRLGEGRRRPKGPSMIGLGEACDRSSEEAVATALLEGRQLKLHALRASRVVVTNVPLHLDKIRECNRAM